MQNDILVRDKISHHTIKAKLKATNVHYTNATQLLLK